MGTNSKAEAEKAQNVFQHFTYEGAVDIDAIEDEQMRALALDQINQFGQTPHQVFKKRPHPARRVVRPPPIVATHPQLLRKSVLKQGQQNSKNVKLSTGVQSLIWHEGKILALSANRAFVPPTFNKFVHWNNADNSLRFSVLIKTSGHRVNETVSIHEGLHDGQITTALVTEDGQYLITGGDDAVVSVRRIHRKYKYKRLTHVYSLCAHDDAIVKIICNLAWRVLVSASADRTVCIWDFNNLLLMKKLPVFPTPVVALAIDHTHGSIVVCCGMSLFMFSVNGDLIAQGSCASSESEAATSLAFTRAPDYVESLIVTGHRNGKIRFWEPRIIGSEGNSLNTGIAKRRSRSHESRARHSRKLSRKFTAKLDSVVTRKKKLSKKMVSKYLLPPEAGKPYMSLCFTCEIPNASMCAVNALHTTPADFSRIWSGDDQGNVVCWNISTEEQWTNNDSKCCEMEGCTTKFGLVNRKHLCKACGGVFCKIHSQNKMSIPEYGLMEPVRVCDKCFAEKDL